MLTLQDKFGHAVKESCDNRYNKDVRYVATHLRAEDFDEVFALTGKSPHYEVLNSWEMSTRRFMIFSGDLPIAVFGVVPLHPYSTTGVIWLLGTDGLNKIKKFFLQISKMLIEELKKGFDTLINFVDSRYAKTLRWLEWCGFTIYEPIEFGINDELFNPVSMECN